MESTALHILLILLGNHLFIVKSQSTCSAGELLGSVTFQDNVVVELTVQPSIEIKVSWSLLNAECFLQVCVNFLPINSIESICTDDVNQFEVIAQSIPCNIDVSATVQVTTRFSDGIRFIRTSESSNVVHVGGNSNELPASPPPNVAATLMATDTNRVAVSWDELNCFNQNSDITGYVLQYGELCSDVRTNITTTRLIVRSGSIQNGRNLGFLSIGRQYVFQVAAKNKNGLGMFSNPVVIIPGGSEIGATCEPPTTFPTTIPPPTTTPPTTASQPAVVTTETTLTDSILPNSTTDMPPRPNNSGGSSTSLGAVVGAVLVILLLLVAASVVLGLWILWKIRHTNNRKGGSVEAAVNSLAELDEKHTDSTSIINITNDDFQLEPTIIDYKRQLYVFEGEQVTIGVDFTGFPKPYITWFFNGRRIEPHYNTQIREDGSLFFISVESNHAGTYDFIISNTAGSVEGCTKLVVYGDDKVVEPPQFGVPRIESNPVEKEKFGDYVSRYHALNDGGFVVQFQTLPSGKENQQDTVAKRAVNRPRNRFGNVVTYDNHRVILEPIPNRHDCQHDYINASFIDGYFKAKKYIATQAPLPKTIVDFWRLVWQEKVQTIVMVTNIMEGLHKKCEQYWPEAGSKLFGPFKITLVDRQPFADYTIRAFNVTLSMDGTPKKITHFHFTAWPDHGVPEYAGPLLTFLRRIRAHHKPNKGVILVHCCAGVGRTGTLISIDTALAQAMKENIINIPSIVSKIRSQRMQMVQTADQYTFIHDAVLEGLICGNTQIPASDFKRAIGRLEKADNKTEQTGYEIQFNVLKQVSPNPRDVMIATALRHPERNRSMDYLPSERWRVILKAQTPDYIHASYANGYKQRKGFIVAQAPMKRTIHDFWKMVYERECGVIVMLSDIAEDGEEICHQYWPELECQEGRKYGSYVATMLDSSEQDGYTQRTIGITHIQSGDVHKVTHFQLFNWTSAGICTDAKALVTVVDKVFIAQRRSGNKSIVVHGNNTVSRCAVFCSLLSSIECCKTEHIVDIFQMVKALRTQKPGSIQTVEQYRFVFEMMRLFLDSFTLYSNFK